MIGDEAASASRPAGSVYMEEVRCSGGWRSGKCGRSACPTEIGSPAGDAGSDNVRRRSAPAGRERAARSR